MPTTDPAGPRRELDALAERYFDALLTASPFTATSFGVPGYDAEVPDLSAAGEDRLAAGLAAVERAVAALDVAALEGQERITHSMLLRACQDGQAEAAARWPELTLGATLNAPHLEVIAAVPKVALVTGERAWDYVERCRKLAGYLDQAGERLRAGVAAGRTPSEHGVRAAMAQIDGYLGAPTADDPLLEPVPPDGVDAGRWRAEVGAAVETTREGMARLRHLAEEEVLPAARPDERCGIRHVAGGEGLYRHAVQAHTTTDLAPEEIHQIGLDLVARLADEYRELGGRVLGERELPAIFARLREDPALRFERAEEILALGRDALDRANAAVPDWFGRVPEAPCDVRAMSPFEAKDATLAYYQPPAGDGSRPGIHWLNTHEPTTRARFEYETLSFHESVPGHHLQMALAHDLKGLPRFRRFGYVTAFSEGWGLYTERLSDEMGLYSDDLSRFGMLSFDSWRAGRLVVDTGMHWLGWSRQQAIDYLLANSPLTPGNVANEVDRYIAWPGQACAYMIGRREIVRLRDEARAALGAGFDIRAFHDMLLGTGGVPLATLTEEAGRWVEASR